MFTEDELFDLMEGFYAYETGSMDSGIHDPVRRAQAVRQFKAMSETDARVFLSRKMRDHYLSEDAIAQGYGIEDAAKFWSWVEDEFCS